MPGSNSSTMPTAEAEHLSSLSTIADAAPTDTGTAIIKAIAELASVPTISGNAVVARADRMWDTVVTTVLP